MPEKPLPPMTSRQAKALYKKSGRKQWSYTDSQMRQADRRDVLDDRRKKLEEVEKKKKLNRLKRDGKTDKERNAIRTLVEEGKISIQDTWGKVTASQPRLNNFFKQPVVRTARMMKELSETESDRLETNVETCDEQETSHNKDTAAEETLMIEEITKDEKQERSPKPLRNRIQHCDHSLDHDLSHSRAKSSSQLTDNRLSSVDRKLCDSVHISHNNISHGIKAPSAPVSEEKRGTQLKVEKEQFKYAISEKPRYDTRSSRLLPVSENFVQKRPAPNPIASTHTSLPAKSNIELFEPTLSKGLPDNTDDNFTDLLAGICTQDLEDYDIVEDKENKDPKGVVNHILEVKSTEKDKMTVVQKEKLKDCLELEDDLDDSDLSDIQSAKEDDMTDDLDDETLLSLAVSPTSRKILAVSDQNSQQKISFQKSPEKAPIANNSPQKAKISPLKSSLSRRKLKREAGDSFYYDADDDEALLAFADALEENSYQKRASKPKKRRRLPWEVNPLPPLSTEEAMLALWEELEASQGLLDS